jgi:hypothetical protein
MDAQECMWSYKGFDKATEPIIFRKRIWAVYDMGRYVHIVIWELCDPDGSERQSKA